MSHTAANVCLSFRDRAHVCFRGKKCYQIPKYFPRVFIVLDVCVCVCAHAHTHTGSATHPSHRQIVLAAPSPSPTSGVATRGASLDSLSVVLLSVSESDSELLSESLELPDPPLAGAAGGG